MSMFQAPSCDLSRQELERFVSGSLMRLATSDRNPFFGALALMAPLEFTDQIETAATDGERLLFNPAFLAALGPEERDGLIVHEVLHAALLHVPRRGSRDPLLWNIACDIVVNGMVASDSRLRLPPGAVRDSKLEHLQVEEVYELIIRQRGTVAYHLGMPDLRPDLGSGAGGPLGDPEARRELERRWSEITARAAMVSRTRGELPEAIERQIGSLLRPKVDWRTRLWQFLVRTPDDYGGFDRRMMWQGLYLEHLESEQVFVDICVDTSGSIVGDQLDAFLAEVRGILHAYHRIEVRLFYADAACHGPFPLSKADQGLPRPIGGGGTDFSPFFEAIASERRDNPDACRVLVYLTDGEGHFPSEHPTLPCLWVVTPGGAADSAFPFGEVLRMT